ncbi:MAG: 1-acyl-sn-glycerol-3-phosphate acyltransferase [Planctomycetia bacterium]|nr:1-acyl-sn-glycerol-3-phosphate acyltransferase [Planctomycetia bacterium]
MSADAIAGWTLAGYALALAGLVLWRALSHPRGWRTWLLYLIAALYSRLCFHWRANRPCPFVDATPALVIANHRCPLDPLLVWVGVANGRPIEFLTAQEYFGTPGLQFIFDTMHSIPVARDGKDTGPTRTALRRLKEGRILGVFPEGRLNRGQGLLPGNIGVAWLALQSQAPVFPVYIHNAPQRDDMVSPLYTFTRVRVSYGDPVDLSEYYGRRKSPELLQEVTDLLMERLAELGGVAPSPHDAPATLKMPSAG